MISKTSAETGLPPVSFRATMCCRINTFSSSPLSLAILFTEPTSFHRFSRKPKRLLSKKPAKTRGKSKRPNPLVLRFGSRFLFVSRRRFLKSDKFLQIPMSPAHLVSLWLTSQYPPGVVLGFSVFRYHEHSFRANTVDTSLSFLLVGRSVIIY